MDTIKAFLFQARNNVLIMGKKRGMAKHSDAILCIAIDMTNAFLTSQLLFHFLHHLVGETAVKVYSTQLHLFMRVVRSLCYLINVECKNR